ncbi:MAG: C-terminal binding protein [Trueperaceae bacterium]
MGDSAAATGEENRGALRVVVTDHGFPDLNVEREVISRFGAQLEEYQATDPDEVARVAERADALLVQFATVSREVIERLQRCRVIVRYGIGVDNVDVEAATANRIPVVNVPDYALDEVADHAMALMLTSVRKIPQVSRQIGDGIWEPNPCRPMYSLSGKTLGLAGFGAIARRVATRAQAFGLRVVAFDPYVAAERFEAQGVEPVSRNQLLEMSDIVSIHLPLTDETHHLFDAGALGRMRPGAYLINTSRGAVVESAALIRSLQDGQLAGAGLDVLEQEPVESDSLLLTLPSVVLTSHCAWYTVEALDRLKRYAAEEVVRVLAGEQPRNVVNGEALRRS